MTPPQGISAEAYWVRIFLNQMAHPNTWKLGNQGGYTIFPMPNVNPCVEAKRAIESLDAALAAARADERVKFAPVLKAAERLIEFTDGVFDPNDDTETEYWCPICGGDEATNSARICNSGCPREELYDAVTEYNKNQTTETQPVEPSEKEGT